MGFARVNSLMGAQCTPNVCQYVWSDDNTVSLKNAYFDEGTYRLCKVADFMDKTTCLSIVGLRKIVDRVLDEHSKLLLDISYATADSWKELDRQMNEILSMAVAEAENEEELRISRSNIQRVQPLDNGWMSFQDVDAMLSLTSRKQKFHAPNPSRFVNGSRH